MPSSRINERVTFGAPGDVKKRGGAGVSGTIEDEVFVLDEASRGKWGKYCYFAQLIQWDSGRRLIRLGYYRKRAGETHWEFESPTTIDSSTATIRKLLALTLAQKGWFR